MHWPKRGASLHYPFEFGRHQCEPQQQGALAGAHCNGILVGGYGDGGASSSPQTTEPRNERQASPRALKQRRRVSGLQSPQRAIKSSPLEQLPVRAALGDLSMV